VRPSVQKGGRRIQLEWERGRVFDKEIAQVFQRIVVEGGGAQVLEFGSKEERKGRPAGLNTVELLKIASSGLNLGPHHAMQVRTSCGFMCVFFEKIQRGYFLPPQVC
jgi:DNA topoisomerase-3